MAKVKLRARALRLRKQGKSYSQIKEILGVSKSTLSLWLRNIPLSEAQLTRLQSKERRIESFRTTMRSKRENKLQLYYRQEKEKLSPTTKRDLFIAGLFLYWGEGNKSSRHTIGIYNTDPAMIRFALVWFTKALGVPKRKIRVNLHLYSDMNIEKVVSFWSHQLGIRRKQFGIPYIKKSRRSDIDHKGFGYGTCALVVANTAVKDRFLMSLQVLTDEFISVYKDLQ